MAVWTTFLKVIAVSLDSLNALIYKFVGDTVLHSWEVLAKILSSDVTKDIVCDIGM